MPQLLPHLQRIPDAPDAMVAIVAGAVFVVFGGHSLMQHAGGGGGSRECNCRCDMPLLEMYVLMLRSESSSLQQVSYLC